MNGDRGLPDHVDHQGGVPTSLSLIGRYAATAAGEEDTVRFAELSGVRPMIETFPFAKAAEGYARMKSGQAKFRVVLTM